MPAIHAPTRHFRSPARWAAVAGAITLTASLAACSSSAPASTDTGTGSADYPVEVLDCGAPLTIEQAPEKVFTVGTAAVELLDAAGASDRIVARSGEFDAPLSEDLSNPPADDLIVDALDPTTEQIIGSGADTVIGYGLFNADPDQITAAGIQLITVAGECGHDASTDAAPIVDFDTIENDIRRFGQIFGTSQTAESYADALAARLAEAQTPNRGEDAAWVYYFSGESGISAYGGQGIPNVALATAGLDNAFADQAASYIDTSMEALLERQPTWIVIGYGFTGDTADQARTRFLAEPGADALDAVAADRIITIPSAVTGAGPTAVTGVELLVAGIDG
jgi:iron complex transport system substrate-binding protein